MRAEKMGGPCSTEHLDFVIAEKKPRTLVWNVVSKSDGAILGKILWYGPWRQYCFKTAAAKDVFSRSCLRQITAFIQAQMDARK